MWGLGKRWGEKAGGCQAQPQPLERGAVSPLPPRPARSQAHVLSSSSTVEAAGQGSPETLRSEGGSCSLPPSCFLVLLVLNHHSYDSMVSACFPANRLFLFMILGDEFYLKSFQPSVTVKGSCID